MKYILSFLLCFSLSFIAFAQQEINTTFSAQMNTIFGSLDKNKIPHSILLDYGMEFTNVPAFNGTLTDSTFSDMMSMSQIYKTLLSSRIKDVTTGFVTPTDYDTRWKNNRSSNYVAIGGLYFKYSQIADNAVATNKITITNGIVYDKYINGVWQNPYQEFQTFAMTPAISKYDGLNLQIRIPLAIFYSNYQSLVQSIQIDFGNGAGYVAVPFDQNYAVNYTAEGVKVWKYKLNLTNGTSLYNQSRIKIEERINTVPYGTTMVASQSTTPTPTFYSQTITGTKFYNGALATVKLTIDLGIGHAQITKPLIVAEGFDLGVIFSPENADGIYTYKNFQLNAFNSQSADLKTLLTGNSLLQYGDQQYDIIYVDWNNGVDYMQRNAYALEEVIKWVNTAKANAGSTEKNVVLGQSMGGVIARYALADMEQSGLIHDTRLFISHDAPQQGANIPVSIQFMYRHLTNLYMQIGTTMFGATITMPLLEYFFGVSNYTSILDAPASKQLLSNFSNTNYGIDNTTFTSFYDELKLKGLANSGGYPVNCRNVAISDGAECGILQGFNPNDDLVNYNWNKGLTFGGDLLSMVYLPLGGTIGGLFINNSLFNVAITGLMPGKSTYNVQFNAKAMPYGSSNQIYKGKISYIKKLLWYGPNLTTNVTDITKYQPAGILPFDTYGGGYYYTPFVTGSLNIPNLYIRDKFNFIPTPSALDIGKRNVILTDNDYKMSYVGETPPISPKNSPFINFTTSFEKNSPNVSNKMHISFDSRNGKWLADELNKSVTTTNCSYMCSSIQITGLDLLCTTATYSVPSGGTFYNWTITQGANLVTLSGNGTQNITLTALPYASGNITLSLTMGDTNKCGSITLTKTIWVGLPSFTVVRDASQNESCDTKYHYVPFYINIPANSSFQLVSSTPTVTYTQGSNNSYTFRFTKGYSGAFNFVFKATNSCGTYLYDSLEEGNADIIKSCTTLGLTATSTYSLEQTTIYTVYPNPSNDIINVNLRDENNLPETQTPIVATLYNMMGEEKRNVSIKNNIATIPVNNLPKGIYILKINIDGTIENHQVVVE